MIRLLLPAAAFIAASCSPAAEETGWGSGGGPEHCDAYALLADASVMVRLSRARGESGIAVFTDAFDDIQRDGLYPDARLEVDGAPVRAEAYGAAGGGTTGLFFSFNPRPLIGRRPDGFAVAVMRNGQRVYSADVRDAAKAFRELRECDIGRLLSREPAA